MEICIYILYFIVCCCGLLLADFTNILQDYFTGVGTLYDSEATRKNMGK